MLMAARRGEVKAQPLGCPQAWLQVAQGCKVCMCQDLSFRLQTATYEVAMRKTGSRTPCWSQATQQSWPLTLAHGGLSVVNFTSHHPE